MSERHDTFSGAFAQCVVKAGCGRTTLGRGGEARSFPGSGMLSAQPLSINTELERIGYEILDPNPRNAPDASSGPTSRAGQSAAGAPSEAQPRSSNSKIGLQSTFPRATRSIKLSPGRQPETGEAEAFPAPEQNLNPLPSTIFPPHDSFCRALAQCVVKAIRPSHRIPAQWRACYHYHQPDPGELNERRIPFPSLEVRNFSAICFRSTTTSKKQPSYSAQTRGRHLCTLYRERDRLASGHEVQKPCQLRRRQRPKS
jgi:hypothetical protein